MAYDISFLCASDAQPWALFLQDKLSEEKYNCSVTVKSLSESGTLDEVNSKEHKDAQVQVLMLSPDFLKPFEETERVDDLPEYSALFPRQGRSVVVFCGYDEDDRDILEIMSKHFRNFNKWAKCVAGQGDGDVNLLLVTICRVLEEENSNGTDSGFPEDDIYNIPPEPIPLEEITFKIIPEQITMTGTEMYILFNESVASPVKLQLDDNLQTEVITQEINPFTYSFIIPENLNFFDSEGAHAVTVFSNGEDIGKGRIQTETPLDCLSRLLDSMLNPVDLLGQSMGISNASQNISTLDLKLKEIFQSNSPSPDLQDVFNVSSVQGQLGSKSSKDTPTILHFAAKFGFKELCAELLTCPGANHCLTLENVNGDLPNDIAEMADHKDLATFLTDYMNTGVPIAMMYNQAVSRRDKSVKETPPDGEAPPPKPCRGGSYLYAEGKTKTADSIYIDMSSAKRESTIIEEEAHQTVASVYQTSVQPRSEGKEERTSALKSPAVKASLPKASSPRNSSQISPQKSPSLRVSPNSSSSSINQSGTSSGTHKKSIPAPKEISSVQTLEAVDQARLRSNSESNAGRDSSVVDDEERDMLPTLPPPFNPGPPLSAKEISSVSVTRMSDKDQALRTIIQSAAEGMVSYNEAKKLVDNWDDQYRSQSSFKDRWKTVNEFQSKTSDEPDSQPAESPSKTKKSKFNISKLFKRKTRSGSDLGLEKNSKTNPSQLGSVSPSQNNYSVKEAIGQIDLSSSSPNNNNQENAAYSAPPLQRTKSIRISHAMQDKDFSNLPELPARSTTLQGHSQKKPLPTAPGHVGAMGASGSIPSRSPVKGRTGSGHKEALVKQVSDGVLSDSTGNKHNTTKKTLPRSSSDSSHFSRTLDTLGELPTRPRLPEPDLSPASKSSR